MSTYPRDLIPILRERFSEPDLWRCTSPPELPADDILEDLLDTAYHASFLTEEGRRPGFRIILLPPPDQFPQLDELYFSKSIRVISFERSRRYTVPEINRLAPAAEVTRLLICIHPCSEDGQTQLRIWGMLDVGENWWRFLRHETEQGTPPPNAVAVTSLNPGELVISVADRIIVSLKGGEAHFPEAAALRNGPLSDFLYPAKLQLHDDAVTRLNSNCWSEGGRDEEWPYRLYVFFLERILFCIRERRHGGTLIMLPSGLSRSDTRVTDRISIKYPCDYNSVWNTLVDSLVNHRRYYDSHFHLSSGAAISTEEFRDYTGLNYTKELIEESITDQAQTIASFSSVDGAIVINDRFALLGFGAEVSVPSPTLTHVMLHSGSQPMRPIEIEAFGTRHRSAFRICSSFEEAVAFVVSQDGGVKAVKRVGSNVVLWPDINPGTIGI